MACGARRKNSTAARRTRSAESRAGRAGVISTERAPDHNCTGGATMASNSLTRVAIYGRVSTTNHGQDVTMQTGEMGEFCQRRGWSLVDSYLDVGISGSKERRPELDRLMADARRRRFDIVLVYRYDRFARSLRHLVNALE